MAPTRVLVAILVYNGRSFVPACVESVARARDQQMDVDVIVLDDCSPDLELSGELRVLAQSLEVVYYRSPRNLGIPRNMNLALLRSLAADYDYTLIVNSDVVVPANLVARMVDVAECTRQVGSVTAWSNNVSMFSIPNDDTGAIRRPEMVDWVSSELASEFGDAAFDVPTAVGFCMLLPTPVVREVGLFDPVYGRGYCEEVDWSLRAKALGFRAVLAPGTFVFHAGRGSTLSAGLVTRYQTSVGEHESIVTFRYPSYPSELQEFVEADALAPLRERAGRAIVLGAARRWGYAIEASWFQHRRAESGVRFTMKPDGRTPKVVGRFCGFRMELTLTDDELPDALSQRIGRPPEHVTLRDRGRTSSRLAAADWDGAPIFDRRAYPERV